MASSFATSNALNLSQLPPPQVIETFSYESILADMRADLATRLPGFDAFVESDPAVKILQVAAFREMVLRQEFNDRARSQLLAYASGADLDHIAARVAVSRLVITPANPTTGAVAVMESDDDLRRRILLAPSQYSVAGPASAYVFHALSASGDVDDASAISPAPGDVTVTVLARAGDGTASPALIATVAARVAADDVRPLTDSVTVQGAAITLYAVHATLYRYAGPDAGLIIDAARASLQIFVNGARRLGRDIPRSALIAALHVPGIQRVVLTLPVADLDFDLTAAGSCDSILLTDGGIAE